MASLFKSVSKEKRDRDQNVAQTLKERQNIPKILERKAEMAARGEKLAQQRSYDAEADVEVTHWEKRISDIALDEINQEFESQRHQLQQANQWAGQAQRDKISLYGELEMMNRLFREYQAQRTATMPLDGPGSEEFLECSRRRIRRAHYFDVDWSRKVRLLSDTSYAKVHELSASIPRKRNTAVVKTSARDGFACQSSYLREVIVKP